MRVKNRIKKARQAGLNAERSLKIEPYHVQHEAVFFQNQHN